MMRRDATALALVALLAGCPAFLDHECTGLRMHSRNQTGDAYGISVTSSGSKSWGMMGGSGCSCHAPDWAVSIGGSGPRGGPVGDYATLFTATDVGPDPEVWIDIAPDGRVSWGEGQPEWAVAHAPTCGKP